MINKKPILVVFAISIALIFLMAPVAAASHSINPAVTSTSTGNYQPDPTLNTNATWATFHHGWNATEYNNGSANVSLNAGLSTFYQNPITVNPMDISAQALEGNITGINLGAITNWTTAGAQGGAVFSSISKSGHTISTSLNESASATQGNAGAGTMLISKLIPTTSLPSSNANYDYITVAWNMEGARNSAMEIAKTTKMGFLLIIYVPPLPFW